MTTAESLGVPGSFNAASYFVDRHVAERRGPSIAIECGGERVTYAELHERTNRFGSALRSSFNVRVEERVALLLLDGPAFAYAFFGAIKIGAVPIPVNTLWKAADYRYLLNDSKARVLVVSEELLPEVAKIPREDLPGLEHVLVVGRRPAGDPGEFDRFLAEGTALLDAEPVSRDAPAFWLYSSGSTGQPKGCVHLQHDMVICAELFAKGVLGITSADRCFSVAKLFFAYGLGNALYFPLGSRWHQHSLARATDARARVRDDRGAPADAVLLGAYRLRHAAWPQDSNADSSRPSGSRSRPAKPYRPRSTNASSSASASTSSTASAPPRRCRCSSRTGLTPSAPAPAGCWCLATTRVS